MISRDLESIFESRGARRDGALLLGEADALALIDEAQRAQIAILGVDQCRSADADTYARLDREGRGFDLMRGDSWSRAREFITDLSGRGLLFEVALEGPRSTRLHRFGDRPTPFRTWSAVFQAVFLAYLALLLAVVFRMLA
jgi:hypothetical protein